MLKLLAYLRVVSMSVWLAILEKVHRSEGLAFLIYIFICCFFHFKNQYLCLLVLKT